MLGEGKVETESYWVNKYDSFNNMCDNEGNQPMLSKILAKHYQSVSPLIISEN